MTRPAAAVCRIEMFAQCGIVGAQFQNFLTLRNVILTGCAIIPASGLIPAAGAEGWHVGQPFFHAGRDFKSMREMFARYRILLFCLLLLLVPATAGAAKAKMVSIAGKEVNLRSGPSDADEVMWVLGTGFPLEVIKSQGKWLKVSDFENDTGWVYAPLTGSTPHVIVKAKLANIRSGPGEKYRVTGQASYGVVFRTLERTKHWVKVKHQNGKTGWVARGELWGW